MIKEFYISIDAVDGLSFNDKLCPDLHFQIYNDLYTAISHPCPHCVYTYIYMFGKIYYFHRISCARQSNKTHAPRTQLSHVAAI